MKSLEDVSTQRTVSTAIFILSCCKKKKRKKIWFSHIPKNKLSTKSKEIYVWEVIAYLIFWKAFLFLLIVRKIHL